jgi:hypothetical protein
MDADVRFDLRGSEGVRDCCGKQECGDKEHMGPCDTYLYPALLLHFESLVFGFGAIDGDPLARRCEIIRAVDSGPLSVLHF